MGILGHGLGRTHSFCRIRRLKTPKLLPEFQLFLVKPKFKPRVKLDRVVGNPFLSVTEHSARPVQKHSFAVLRGMCHWLAKAKW